MNRLFYVPLTPLILLFPSLLSLQVHSLPGLSGRLVCRSYELCEAGDVASSSDHRPVSLAATLLLDTTRPDRCAAFFRIIDR